MSSKAELIERVLDYYFPPPIPIPLNYADKFTLLVAVVLSAQTTDGKVNDVTRTLFSVAPTPQILGKLEISYVESIIKSVGLAPQKAKYLVNLSKMIVEEFDGLVPSNYKDLEKLPGVGHKTASVVLSQAFGHESFAVDTHVHRLSLRWGLSKDQKNVDKVQEDLCRFFQKEKWNKLHLQMIYFGREFCSAKGHENQECPICCWVNKKELAIPPDLRIFTSQKRAKGIVFYSDRKLELVGSPHLTPTIVSEAIRMAREGEDQPFTDSTSVSSTPSAKLIKTCTPTKRKGTKASKMHVQFDGESGADENAIDIAKSSGLDSSKKKMTPPSRRNKCGGDLTPVKMNKTQDAIPAMEQTAAYSVLQNDGSPGAPQEAAKVTRKSKRRQATESAIASSIPPAAKTESTSTPLKRTRILFAH